MADIITLKDNVTKEAMYPRTVTSAVLDEDGNPLDSLLEVVNEEFEKTIYGTVTSNPASILD